MTNYIKRIKILLFLWGLAIGISTYSYYCEVDIARINIPEYEYPHPKSSLTFYSDNTIHIYMDSSKQRIRIYNSYVDSSNYEKGEVKWKD